MFTNPSATYTGLAYTCHLRSLTSATKSEYFSFFLPNASSIASSHSTANSMKCTICSLSLNIKPYQVSEVETIICGTWSAYQCSLLIYQSLVLLYLPMLEHCYSATLLTKPPTAINNEINLDVLVFKNSGQKCKNFIMMQSVAILR